MTDKNYVGSVVAVGPPVEENLNKYIKEVKDANPDWTIRKTLKRVTYELLGADV